MTVKVVLAISNLSEYHTLDNTAHIS